LTLPIVHHSENHPFRPAPLDRVVATRSRRSKRRFASSSRLPQCEGAPRALALREKSPSPTEAAPRKNRRATGLSYILTSPPVLNHTARFPAYGDGGAAEEMQNLQMQSRPRRVTWGHRICMGANHALCSPNARDPGILRMPRAAGSSPSTYWSRLSYTLHLNFR